MKEIIDLHQRLLAQEGGGTPESLLYFTRDEEEGPWNTLPADLQTEILDFQQTLDRLVAEDFDYHVIFGSADAPAEFCLYYDDAPAGSGVDGTFDPARSLFDQLRVLDWKAQRDLAEKNGAALDRTMRQIERISAPLPSAKQFQRLFREQAKEFIKEKRRDTAQVHVMYWREADDGLTEVGFPGGEALREALPDLVGEGAELVTIVAHGKPLPVEKIDALKATAIKVYAHKPYLKQGEADDDVIDVEAEIVEQEPELPVNAPPAG